MSGKNVHIEVLDLDGKAETELAALGGAIVGMRRVCVAALMSCCVEDGVPPAMVV